MATVPGTAPQARTELDLLIGKLDRLNRLDAADLKAIRGLPWRSSEYRSNHYLVREGDVPTHCCLLLSGYACRHKIAGDGGRQIVSFHMAGDLLDIQHLQLDRADHNVETITAADVAWIPISVLRRLLVDNPRIADAIWRDALIDASIFREWVLNVGRRDAKKRIAHMLCEFAARRDAAGLGSPDCFDLPMTQEHIADATGLTSIHVNRMLRELTSEGVISREGRSVRITDWDLMRRVADFDPAYLHAAA